MRAAPPTEPPAPAPCRGARRLLAPQLPMPNDTCRVTKSRPRLRPAHSPSPRRLELAAVRAASVPRPHSVRVVGGRLANLAARGEARRRAEPARRNVPLHPGQARPSALAVPSPRRRLDRLHRHHRPRRRASPLLWRLDGSRARRCAAASSCLAATAFASASASSTVMSRCGGAAAATAGTRPPAFTAAPPSCSSRRRRSR